MFWGMLLVIIGVLILLQELDVIRGVSFWGYIWPVLIIAIGFKMLTGGKGRKS